MATPAFSSFNRSIFDRLQKPLPRLLHFGLAPRPSQAVIPRLRQSPAAGAFLDGVNVASLALMAIVTWRLGIAAIVDWPTALLALSAAVLLLRYEINFAWLVLGGAIVGLLRY